MKVMSRPLVTLLFVFGIQIALPAQQRASDPDPERFAKSIEAFVKQDQDNGIKKGGIVFVGSSSIRRLDIPAVFPGLDALNRGFGGSHISDVNHYIEETVLQYEPSLVFLYCGGNDLWNRKPALQVLEDFQEFCAKFFERVPRAHLVVLACRPSPSRETIFETEIAFNYLLEIEAAKDRRITFERGACDTFFDNKGKYFEDLYADDKLHMSAKGYQIWNKILTPYLPK
jgi:lysophospholipase L1-like esterase